jgi:hypothetical protein
VRRRLVNLATVLSTVMCCATVALFVRSHRVVDYGVWVHVRWDGGSATRTTTRVSLVSGEGGVGLIRASDVHLNPSKGLLRRLGEEDPLGHRIDRRTWPAWAPPGFRPPWNGRRYLGRMIRADSPLRRLGFVAERSTHADTYRDTGRRDELPQTRAVTNTLTLVGVPLWFVAAVFAWIPAIRARTAWRARRHRSRAAAGRCPTCDYHLTANTSGVCPECGSPTARPSQHAPTPERSLASHDSYL